jgi:hypothetical protein
MLARLGVPKDIRAQLQSHALGGVQERHYDPCTSIWTTNTQTSSAEPRT